MLLGFAAAFWLGGLKSLFLVAILAALEISLSVDNAILNARVLQRMSPIWRSRFLTWGLAIAVFGVRFLLPILMVSILGAFSPWEALRMAVGEPQQYSHLLLSAHHLIVGFGASFLLTVALHYFLRENNKIHWIKWLERRLSQLGRVPALEMGLTILVMLAMSTEIEHEKKIPFLGAAAVGLLTYFILNRITTNFSAKEQIASGWSLFIYLETLDASFSVDGVVGAFAISYDLVVIVIGLLIGAMFVRGLTVLMVEKKTLSHFIYLEHGAFYALGALAILMLVGLVMPVPESITGLVGAVFLVLSIFSSYLHRRRNA